MDDRIIVAAAGAGASLGACATAAWFLRGRARVQAACWALLGRPVAYRLHLHGTGIELAPWERNLVAECVIRNAPASGVRIGPVEPRPDEGGSVVRDTQVHRARGDGFRCGEEPGGTGGPAAAAEDAEPRYPVYAVCAHGHEFDVPRFAYLAAGATFTLHSARTGLQCPECGAPAEIRAGRYSVSAGRAVREDLAGSLRNASGNALTATTAVPVG